MLTMLILACKSDQGLQNNNQNPGRSLDQEACECPDNTAELTELQEELNTLRDRVVTLESAPEPEVPASSVVVTEYEVDCGSPSKMFDLLAWDGLPYPLNYIEDWSELSNSVRPQGCVLAKIDPLDPPWAINQVAIHDARRGLSATGGGGYEDPYALYGNPWYWWHYPLSETQHVHEEGFVLYKMDQIEWDCSSGALDVDGDCPIEMPVVRVVIFDDKPALRPEAW